MADLRLTPPSLNLEVFSSQGVTVVFTWPAGALDGRTFVFEVETAEGDIVFNPTLEVDGDEMTVTVSAGQATSVYGRAADWRLLDTTTVPEGLVVMGGRFKSTNQLGTPTDRVVEVVDRLAEVPVRVLGAPGPQGPPGVANVPDYAGGDFDEGDLVFYGGELWRANDDLVAQNAVTLDENNFAGPWPPAATTTGRAIAFAIIFGG